MGKPLKDWTFGEVKKLCQSMNHCWACELRSGETSCSVADMVRGRRRPMEWELPEPPPLTEPELAICRSMGAKWVSQDEGAYNTHVSLWDSKPRMTEAGLWTADNSFLGFVRIDRFPSVCPNTCVEVPDG